MFAAGLAGADKFFVSAGAAAAVPGDSRFRDFYGTVQFSPELKAGVTFFKSFYALAGLQFLFRAAIRSRTCSNPPAARSNSWRSGSAGKPAAAAVCSPISSPPWSWAGYRETALGTTDQGLRPGLPAGNRPALFFQQESLHGDGLFLFRGPRLFARNRERSRRSGDLLGRFAPGHQPGRRAFRAVIPFRPSSRARNFLPSRNPEKRFSSFPAASKKMTVGMPMMASSLRSCSLAALAAGQIELDQDIIAQPFPHVAAAEGLFIQFMAGGAPFGPGIDHQRACSRCGLFPWPWPGRRARAGILWRGCRRGALRDREETA